MNVILIGPQGCGKGTQAEKLVEVRGFEHIETGKMIREKAHEHSKKGELIEHLATQKGVLLPDGVVLDMLIDELDKKGWENVLFDGFPRTLQQYQSLKELLEEKGSKIDLAIYIGIPDEVAIERMMSRGREDDTKTAIEQRLAAFHENTEKVLKALEDDGVLRKVDGQGSIEEVWDRVRKLIG